MNTTSDTSAIELTEKEIIKHRNIRDLVHILAGIQITLFIVISSIPDTNENKIYMWIALLLASVIRGYFEIKQKSVLSITICCITAAYAINGLTV